MEVPKQKDRWDSPYFEVRHNEKTPFEEIAEVLLFQDKKARDPTATKIVLVILL
jgi:protein KTI12